MIRKGSRYETHQTFKPDESGESVFRGIRPREIPATPGVIEHAVREGERLDLIARHYFNDDRLWWRILDANPQVLFGGSLSDEDARGETVLIPKARK